MIALFRVFLDICLLRSGPQILPASGLLLGIALSAHWLVGFVHGALSMEPIHAASAALVGTVAVVAILHLLLALRARGTRAAQTLAAVAGGESILGVLALPVSVLFQGGESALAAFVILGFIFWNLVFVAHVLRHALDVTLPAGVGFATGYIMLSYAIVDIVIGQGA